MASRKQQRIDPNRVQRNQVPARLEDDVRIPREAHATGPAQKSKSGRPGGRPPTAAKVRKAKPRDWIAGARLRTLPLSIAPVALGTAAAHTAIAPWAWWRIALALAVAVCLQIGVNYANDYSDGIRGTDKFRLGPSRLTGSGAAKPRTVLTVALVFLGLAAVAGAILVVHIGQYWLFAIGAVCIAAAYFYTGGKRPYGYYGLGELFVFVFFGLVATAGTTFVQLGHVNLESWLSGVAVGFIACAVLMVNNIRDLPQDKLAGKRTLAVLIGNMAARIVFTVFLLLPFVILIYFVLLYPNATYTYFALFLALPAVLITLTAKTPKELVLALQLTSFTALVYAVGLGWALAF
ncbi:MAG: 1,4-dihydroxy-2-naphthoate polyprenyltransferase [Actinomycetota bacterium]|nr:1,4-dihydroxy-2-naphthoate polyprenyltransferase [Actinomycetota bacterium]